MNIKVHFRKSDNPILKITFILNKKLEYQMIK